MFSWWALNKNPFLCQLWVRCHHNSCSRRGGLSQPGADAGALGYSSRYSRAVRKIYQEKNIQSSKNISPSSGDLRTIRSPRLGRMHFRQQSNSRECESWTMNERLRRSITFDEREQISAVRFLCWNYFNSVWFPETCHETSWGMSLPRPSPITRSSPRCKC